MSSAVLQGFVLCPNLPFRLGPRLWDEDHMPAADEDDAALYGSDSKIFLALWGSHKTLFLIKAYSEGLCSVPKLACWAMSSTLG